MGHVLSKKKNAAELSEDRLTDYVAVIVAPIVAVSPFSYIPAVAFCRTSVFVFKDEHGIIQGLYAEDHDCERAGGSTAATKQWASPSAPKYAYPCPQLPPVQSGFYGRALPSSPASKQQPCLPQPV